MNDQCNSIRRLLSEQRDRPLTTTEQTTLRDHLAGCAGCRAFDRDLHTGLAGIARLPRVSGSSEVRESVLAGVHPGGRSAWPRGWRDWTSQMLKIGGAVTAFALVAVILMAVFGGSGDGDSDRQFGSTGAQRGPFVDSAATPEPVATMPDSVSIDTPPICHPDQVEYELQVEPVPDDPATNSPSAVQISVDAVKSTGGILCRVEAPVSLTIADEAGTPLDIQGNPVMGIIDATLGVDDARVAFAWLNWCGAPGPFSLSAEIVTSSNSETATGQSTDFAPNCDDERQPSILGLSAEAEMMSGDVNENCRGAATMTTAIDSITGGVQIWYVVDMSTGCGNDEGGRFQLEEPSGGLLEIEGNDSDVTLRASEAGAFEWIGMLWTNWCGDLDQVKLELGDDTWGFGSWVEERPTCQDAGQPSRLTALDTPPADPWPAGENPSQPIPLPEMTSEPPVCDPASLQLLLLPVPEPGLYFAIGASAGDNADAETCSLDASDLTLTITNANGQPIAVEGNGVTFTLGRDDPLLLNSTGSETVVWDNWCGEPGPFTITATIAGRTSTLEVANGPECMDEDQSSMIWGANHGREPRRP